MEDKKYKVFFVQKINQDKYETESLWCIRQGENFVIDNIPFVAKRVSLGDTIKAEYDPDEKVYYFEDFVKVSGNTTVRLYFNNGDPIENTRNEMILMGCEGEIFAGRKILAINVPKDINYIPIKLYLEKGEQAGKWTYEESCLAHDLSVYK